MRRFLPGLGRSLSRWEMIAIALNAGNEAGYAALTGQAGFAPEAVSPILQALDGRDARFVAAVWDYLESFRGEIAARERRATGGAPKWAVARPVSVGGVALKGGFYPLIREGDLAAGVRAGRFAKAMAGGGEGAPTLDLTLLHAFVDGLLHDLELSEAVTNAGRLLGQPELREGFTVNGREGDLETLAAWLDGVAAGDLRPADFLLRMVAAEGRDPLAERLAQDLAAALTEAAGLPRALERGAVEFAAGVVGSFGADIGDRIAERSTLMAGRWAAAAKRGEAGKDAVAPLADWLRRRARWHLIDIPLWLAGHAEGLARSGGEAQAVAEGDAAVRRVEADGKAEAAVKTMVAAFFRSRPDAAAGDLTRALGAALLLARKAVVLQAMRAEGEAGPIGSAPAIRDAAPAPRDAAARAAMWAARGDGAIGAVDGRAARSAMMASALLIDAPPAVAIGHVFGSGVKQTPAG